MFFTESEGFDTEIAYSRSGQISIVYIRIVKHLDAYDIRLSTNSP